MPESIEPWSKQRQATDLCGIPPYKHNVRKDCKEIFCAEKPQEPAGKRHRELLAESRNCWWLCWPPPMQVQGLETRREPTPRLPPALPLALLGNPKMHFCHQKINCMLVPDEKSWAWKPHTRKAIVAIFVVYTLRIDNINSSLHSASGRVSIQCSRYTKSCNDWSPLTSA